MNINADIGESYGRFRLGNDQALMPFLDRCSIACGYHGGDPTTIINAIRSAVEHQVEVGAHPGYPDLQGFGRRPMQIDMPDFKSMVQYQVSALQGLSKMLGTKVKYVKPHGAMYHTITRDTKKLKIFIEAVQELDPSLSLMVISNPSIENQCIQMGIQYIGELFIDRSYDSKGFLVSRANKNAVLTEVDSVLRSLDMLVEKLKQPIDKYSFCIHGDNPNALNIMKTVRQKFN